jgi:hypothetical protein
MGVLNNIRESAGKVSPPAHITPAPLLPSSPAAPAVGPPWLQPACCQPNWMERLSWTTPGRYPCPPITHMPRPRPAAGVHGDAPLPQQPAHHEPVRLQGLAHQHRPDGGLRGPAVGGSHEPGSSHLCLCVLRRGQEEGGARLASARLLGPCTPALAEERGAWRLRLLEQRRLLTAAAAPAPAPLQVGGKRAFNGFKERTLPHFPRGDKTPAGGGGVGGWGQGRAQGRGRQAARGGPCLAAEGPAAPAAPASARPACLAAGGIPNAVTC